MLFKDITIIDEYFEIREHQYVGIKDDRIVYLSDKEPKEKFGDIYDGKNRLLIPAFYNEHSHLPMALLRGYGENLSLMEWLQGRIFPFEAKLRPEDMYYGALFGAAECVRYGIGAVSEMYLDIDADTRAMIDSGLKANVSQCCTCPEDIDFSDHPVCKNTLDAIRKYHHADGDRIRVEFSLHAEYTSSEKIARSLACVAKQNDSSMHVHVSETKGEVEACRERRQGRTPVRYLADCGIFDVPTVAAHCIHLDEEDFAILKEHNVTVASCPKSNAKLASGFCPDTDLLRAGVNIAIGTDSVASNNNLNMVEEMRFFNLLHKAISFDPTVLTPVETLYSATRAGALAQNRPDCGLIKEGFKADLTVFDIGKIYMQPVHNLLNNLIYSADGADVKLTMVDGKILYNDGNYPTLDIERILYECERSRKRILNELS